MKIFLIPGSLPKTYGSLPFKNQRTNQLELTSSKFPPPAHLLNRWPPSPRWSLEKFLDLSIYSEGWMEKYCQWLFLVPLKGGRWHIIPQLAVYTTYIPLIYCLLGGYIIPTTLYRNLKNPLILGQEPLPTAIFTVDKRWRLKIKVPDPENKLVIMKYFSNVTGVRHATICIYKCTWNPNDHCFDWKRPCFGGLKLQNRGQTGSRYIYRYICINV